MKNRNTIIGLTVAIFLLCVYYLSFTFKARSIESDAKAFATNAENVYDAKLAQRYKDSLWDSEEPIYNLLIADYTYKEVKSNELALGLDLQGGMHVTLEVSPVDIIKALAANSSNADLQKALELAQKNQQASTANFVDLFRDAYNEVAPDGNLARIFTNTGTRGQISLSSSNQEVINLIRKEVEDAFDRTFNIIRTRIDKFGVANPNIQKLPGTNRILVELPGVDNPERVRKLLSGVAKLEFWEVWNTVDILPSYQQFAAYLAKEEQKKIALGQGTKKDGDTTSQPGSSDLVADVEPAEEDTSVNTEDAVQPLEVEEEAEEEEAVDPLIAEDDEEADSLIVEDETEDQSLIAEGEDSTAEVEEIENDTTDLAAANDSTQNDTSAVDTEEELDSAEVANQVAQATRLLQPIPGSIGFQVNTSDTARVNELLARQEVRSLFPSNLKFLWDVKPNEATKTITLYPIKQGRGRKAPLEGDVIVDARQDFTNGQPDVSMQMNATGAKQWKRLTAANIQNHIAIVLDNYVYSAPVVQNEIPNGSSQISGNFTIEEAQDLANILKAGKLPAPARIVEEATVGPSLGAESINQGLVSMLIGLALVVVFMFLYYQSSGLVADLALLINIFFVIGILAQFGAVLTLPGMAGIVLTIGMSVDANVLIYERIREELASKKNFKNAVKLGYEKAYSSIIDANATTFLTGVILYSFGSGGIKGFAVTLMIGIICSLFSAIFITRLLIEFFTRKQGQEKISFNSYILKSAFNKFNFNFIDQRQKAYIGSGVIIALGLVLLIAQGLTLGVDFKGGRSYVVQFDEPVSVNEARQSISSQFEGSTEIKTFGGNNKLKITTSYLIEEESNEADKQVEAKLLKGLEAFKDKKPEILSFSKVGATIADDIANTSYLVVGFSLLVIFLYIVVRFSKWQYGLGALVALVHDVLIVIAFMGFAKLLGFSYEVDQVFIAAMLTVVGYSINDTVVVFDRIREDAGDITKPDFGEKLNTAINNTLSRTIMTSSTTLLVVLILFLFGGEVLRGFSYALLIGVLIGTYSSVFIASPIVLDISLWLQKNQAQQVAKAKTKGKPKTQS